MPVYVQSPIENFSNKELIFSAPAGVTTSSVQLADGSLVLSAVPLIADMDMVYLGYELPLFELFGIEVADDFSVESQEFIGRLTRECAEGTLDQFEGLALTDGHVTIEPGFREDFAVGAFLCDGTLVGNEVRTRALVYSATSIIKVDTQGSELSIGGMAFMEANPLRGAQGEPDFFIHRINLNHVALVENGRAGHLARLLNHRALLAQSKKEIPHMKITIDGVELEVPDVAVNHFSAIISTVKNEVATLTTSVTELTAERDTAQGALAAAGLALDAAQEQVTTLQNEKPDVASVAAALANTHAAFVVEATRLGHTDELALGAYDTAGVMLTILNAKGAKFTETTSIDTLRGAWEFAIAHAGVNPQAVIDNASGQSKGPQLDARASSQAAVNASYFGKKKGA